MAHQLLETTGIPTKLMTCFSWKSCYCAWISAVLFTRVSEDHETVSLQDVTAALNEVLVSPE